MDNLADDTWNKFVMQIEPDDYEAGSSKRAAAIANLYMGLANNGGINSFLTGSYDLDTSEVLKSLKSIGASKAADQFAHVIELLGGDLPVSSQQARWDVLEERWTDEMDDIDGIDILSRETDDDLVTALRCHVMQHEEFYRTLK